MSGTHAGGTAANEQRLRCAWRLTLSVCAGASDGFSPGELRVFTNRDDLDFATAADVPPTQSWELAENLDGRIELPTQVRSVRNMVCDKKGLRWLVLCVSYDALTSRDTRLPLP